MTSETQTRIREVALRAAALCDEWGEAREGVDRSTVRDAVERELAKTLAGADGLIAFLGADLAEFLYVELSRDGWDDVDYDQPSGSLCLWSALREAVADDTLALLQQADT
jgi:hypothetical protein